MFTHILPSILFFIFILFYFIVFYILYFLQYNVDKKRNDEKGTEDGGMQKSFPKLFYKEREENGWDVMIMVSGGV